MDIVYTLGTGSKWRNNEIKYSLRSVEKHLKGYDKIFIVGELTYFLTNVIHIPCKDVPFRKEFSIYSKIMAAVNDDRVSERFLFMNDDHFFLQDIEVSEIPDYYEGTLEDKIKKRATGHYGVAMKNTLEHLENLFPQVYKFTDVHTPIIYEKSKWKQIPHDGKEYVLKSLYSGYWGENFEPMEDLKINKPMTLDELKAKICGRKFFSIGDYAVNLHLTTLMNELYKKSKYENTNHHSIISTSRRDI